MELFIYDLKVGSARSDLRTESIYFSDPQIKYDISQIYSDLTLEWTTTLGGGISFRISSDPEVESASPDSIIRSESATPHVCLWLGMVTTCLFSGPVG